MFPPCLNRPWKITGLSTNEVHIRLSPTEPSGKSEISARKGPRLLLPMQEEPKPGGKVVWWKLRGTLSHEAEPSSNAVYGQAISLLQVSGSFCVTEEDGLDNL